MIINIKPQNALIAKELECGFFPGTENTENDKEKTTEEKYLELLEKYTYPNFGLVYEQIDSCYYDFEKLTFLRTREQTEGEPILETGASVIFPAGDYSKTLPRIETASQQKRFGVFFKWNENQNKIKQFKTLLRSMQDLYSENKVQPEKMTIGKLRAYDTLTADVYNLLVKIAKQAQAEPVFQFPFRFKGSYYLTDEAAAEILTTNPEKIAYQALLVLFPPKGINIKRKISPTNYPSQFHLTMIIPESFYQTQEIITDKQAKSGLETIFMEEEELVPDPEPEPEPEQKTEKTNLEKFQEEADSLE